MAKKMYIKENTLEICTNWLQTRYTIDIILIECRYFKVEFNIEKKMNKESRIYHDTVLDGICLIDLVNPECSSSHEYKSANT